MSGHILMAFGFGWMVVAALIGLYLGAKHESHLGHLAAAAASGDLVEYHKVFDRYKWRASVHAHGMLFALSSVVVGLVLVRNEAHVAAFGTQALAAALILATVVWTIAAMRRCRPLMGLADLVFVGVMVAYAAVLANGQ
jgi:hypothetical protein